MTQRLVVHAEVVEGQGSEARSLDCRVEYPFPEVAVARHPTLGVGKDELRVPGRGQMELQDLHDRLGEINRSKAVVVLRNRLELVATLNPMNGTADPRQISASIEERDSVV